MIADQRSALDCGAFRQLEILRSPCRNHGDDLLEKVAYRTAFGGTKSPVNTSFKEFRLKFPSLKLESVTTSRNPKFTQPFMIEALQRMKAKCDWVLLDPEARSDRKEFAQQMLDLNHYGHPR